MKTTQGRLEANGLSFVYLERGDGPLVLMLHGFPDTPHGYGLALDALADNGYRAVAPYMRGYAPTQIPDQRDVTMEAIGRDAVALIEALDHETAIVVGHDWGAAAAYYAAAAAPEKVTELVTIGVPHPATVRPSARLIWGGRHFVYLRWPTARAWMRRNGFAHVDALYRRWSPFWRFGPEETAPVKQCFAEPGSLDTALGYYRAVRAGHVPDVLRGKISVDTLAFGGLTDPALDHTDYERAERKFTGRYEVSVLPGGHFMHREHPDVFMKRMLHFLGPA